MLEALIFLGIIAVVVTIKCVQLSHDNNQLRKQIAHDFYDRTVKEMQRPTRLSIRFMKVENVGDNTTFNKQVQEWERQGYRYKADKSVEGVLAFEKLIYEDENKEGEL